MLLLQAYLVPGSRIVGGPAWIDTERYDITAKAEKDEPATRLRPAGRSRATAPQSERRLHTARGAPDEPRHHDRHVDVEWDDDDGAGRLAVAGTRNGRDR